MDHFKPVQVKIEDAKQMGRLTPALLNDAIQPIQKQRSIREARQRVVKGLKEKTLLGLPPPFNQTPPLQRRPDETPAPPHPFFQKTTLPPFFTPPHRHIFADTP